MDVEQIYLRLLRKAIGLTKEETNVSQEQWAAIKQLSHRQGTDMFLTTDKTMLARAMMRQQQQLLTLDIIWQVLEKVGLRPVILKGFGLARFYPEPYRRFSSDVDIWVGKGNYDIVTSAINSVMKVEWHHENEDVNERHYNFASPQGLIFETHPQTIPFILPSEKAALETIELPAMTNAEEFVFEGHCLRMPQAEFNLLFIFMHAWEHFTSSGAGLKHLADLAVLVNNDRLKRQDPDDVLVTLRKLHLLEPWLVMGYVVVKVFDLRKEQWPLYKDTRRIRRLGERLYRRIMDEGLTRPNQSSVKTNKTSVLSNKWLGKLWTLGERIRTALMIAPYSPQYARHYFYSAIYKGVKRLRK